MKQILLLLFISLTLGLSAQGIDYAPDMISETADVEEESLSIEFDIINNTGAESSNLWIIDRGDAPAEWEFQICDKNNCYLWGREDCPSSNPNVFNVDESWTYQFHMKSHTTEGDATVFLNITDLDGAVLKAVPINIVITPVSSIHDLDEKAIQIYPNPTSDLFQINNDSEIAKIAFFNIVGKKLKVSNHFEGKSHDVSQLQKGIYLVRLLDNNDNVLSVVRLNKN